MNNIIEQMLSHYEIKNKLIDSNYIKKKILLI
jgi:hypothetical protein